MNSLSAGVCRTEAKTKTPQSFFEFPLWITLRLSRPWFVLPHPFRTSYKTSNISSRKPSHAKSLLSGLKISRSSVADCELDAVSYPARQSMGLQCFVTKRRDAYETPQQSEVCLQNESLIGVTGAWRGRKHDDWLVGGVAGNTMTGRAWCGGKRGGGATCHTAASCWLDSYYQANDSFGKESIALVLYYYRRAKRREYQKEKGMDDLALVGDTIW